MQMSQTNRKPNNLGLRHCQVAAIARFRIAHISPVGEGRAFLLGLQSQNCLNCYFKRYAQMSPSHNLQLWRMQARIWSSTRRTALA